jgi:hypothetical protein
MPSPCEGHPSNHCPVCTVMKHSLGMGLAYAYSGLITGDGVSVLFNDASPRS